MANLNRILLTVLLLLILLYFGSTLFIPLFFGLLIAIVMYPIAKRLERMKMNRTWAITVCLSIVVILFFALCGLLIEQIQAFRKDLPFIESKLNAALPKFSAMLANNYGISEATQQQWITSFQNDIPNYLSGLAGQTFQSLSNGLFILFLVPVFAALFLYHREMFVRCLQLLVGKEKKIQLKHILRETTATYFNYIKGMVMVYIIVGILNSIGLLALGIEHAFLFGMLTAVMTIIPYIGIIVSALLPVSVAWLTKDSAWYPIGVIGVFVFVQYLEANVIFPKVVGTQLNVSTWATLVAIIAGGILWGVAGMILFIPFAAIAKIVTDHIPEAEALNVLLNRDKGFNEMKAVRPVG